MLDKAVVPPPILAVDTNITIGPYHLFTTLTNGSSFLLNPCLTPPKKWPLGTDSLCFVSGKRPTRLVLTEDYCSHHVHLDPQSSDEVARALVNFAEQ